MKDFDPSLIPFLILLFGVVSYVVGRAIVSAYFKAKFDYNRRFLHGDDNQETGRGDG